MRRAIQRWWLALPILGLPLWALAPAPAGAGTARTAQAAAAAPAAGTSLRGRGEHVLLADDDDVVGALQRDTQRTADPPCGNDSDSEPGRTQSVELLHCSDLTIGGFSSFQSCVAGTGRSPQSVAQSSRRRRRPPPLVLACSRANNSAAGCPPTC